MLDHWHDDTLNKLDRVLCNEVRVRRIKLVCLLAHEYIFLHQKSEERSIFPIEHQTCKDEEVATSHVCDLNIVVLSTNVQVDPYCE